MSDDWKKTWLRFDDVECVRCRKWCGPEGSDVYVHGDEGLVCVECHEAALIDGDGDGR